MKELTPTSPLTIGRYAFHAEIASGGMATVHFARLVGPGHFSRIVAAKRLLPHLVKDQSFTAMLMDEARVAARIHHQNVLSTLDVVSTGEELVIVMEYVHGESLARLMRTAADMGDVVPLPIAVTIIVDALHGLHAAHEAKDENGQSLGLVHRDISPQNLLVGVDGVTKIADFGIAMASGRSQETRDGTIKGKLSYMAPEQIERTQALTRAVDIFAISIVLWELLTGERLFEGANDGEIVNKILNREAPSVRSIRSEISEDLASIVATGLAKIPDARFETALEMAQQLEKAVTLVRPSEVGAWVTSTASDTLVRRARMIAKIEGSETIATSPEAAAVSTKVLPTPATLPEGVGPNTGTGAQVSWSHSSPGRRSGGLWLVAVGLLSALAGAAFWLSRGPHDSPVTLEQRSAAASAQLAVPSSAPAEPGPALSDAPAEPAPSGVTAAAPSVESSSSRADDGAPAQGRGRPGKNRRAPLPAAKATGAKTPAEPAAKPAPTANCNPPYSIDASGRRIFKLECM